jgi:hypothetical protein
MSTKNVIREIWLNIREFSSVNLPALSMMDSQRYFRQSIVDVPAKYLSHSATLSRQYIPPSNGSIGIERREEKKNTGSNSTLRTTSMNFSKNKPNVL